MLNQPTIRWWCQKVGAILWDFEHMKNCVFIASSWMFAWNIHNGFTVLFIEVHTLIRFLFIGAGVALIVLEC